MYPLMRRVLSERVYNARLFRFAFIGGVGFIVDSCVFGIGLYLFSFPVLPARVAAFICSATATWLGNRTFTFNHKEGSLFKQWRNFFATACVSAIPNFIVFSLIVDLFGKAGYLPFVALVCGVLTGMFCNYFLCSRWVFVKRT
jgi:putative flippase GtrA